MNDKINQDTINKALWAACDTFRGTISADTYKDFILTMLFLKYISDVWQDHYDEYKKQYGKTYLEDFESKAPVGSSAKIREGSVTKALAHATLCFCPPDN